MKIGFDAKRAVNNLTGLGNYSRLVIGELAGSCPDDRLLLYAPRLRENPRLTRINALPNVEYRLPQPGLLKGSLWRTWGITGDIRRDGVELFHGLSNELPLNIRRSGIPSVVTVHDLIFLRCPDFYKPADRILYNYKYGASCRNADRIIAVSERTKADIVDIYGTDPERIDVVYQGCDDSFRRPLTDAQLEETRRRLCLPESYILQVGTVEERKNLIASVRALAKLPADVHLVAVGRDHHGYLRQVMRVAAGEGVAERLHVMGNVAFADLPAVYRMARLFLYPSRYEGFGIPVLEALESEIPVIAATGSCLEEAGGDAAFYVSPDDSDAIADIAREILLGNVDTDAIAARGKLHARRFNTVDMVRSIKETYARLL